MAEKITGSLSANNGLQVQSLSAGTETIYENDYNKLINKPVLSGITLEGDVTLEDIGFDIPTPLSNIEIEKMLGNL